MDESAEHIVATSADFFERFQSPAAIGASEAERRPAMIREVRESPTFYSRPAYLRL